MNEATQQTLPTTPAGATSALPEKKREKFTGLVLSNSKRQPKQQRQDVAMFSFGVDTSYDDLPKKIKEYMDSVKTNKLTPKWVVGTLYCQSPAVEPAPATVVSK